MITSLRDIHHAARTLSRSPGFTAVAVLTLALGIGANTAIFSVVEGVLLRPLPYPDPDELVQVRHVHENGSSMLNFSFLNYADVREQSRSFDALTAWQDWNATVTDDGGATRVGVADVTAGFFDAMDVEPAIGRRFAPDEFGPSGAAIAVVGHEYWRGRLGGDPDLSNATVRMGGRAYRVVGVMPEGFDFPGGTGLWLPTEASAATQSRTGHNFQVVGRLADDVTLEQARGEVSAIARRLKATHGDDTNMSDALVVPLREELVGSARPALLVMLGAAAFLLLVACANIVNLLLARNAARQRELSVRLALGAGRTRLARRFLTESLLLALAGGALGVWVAVWGVPALLALEPGALPRLDFIGLNWAVLLFALGVSVLAAAAMGVIPALRASRGDLRTALVGDGRTQTGDASSHR
ncbi:MAG: ABC transporter permease, partial [Gemmatimonadota bacterium]